MDIRDSENKRIIHKNPHKRVCQSFQDESKHSLIILPRRFAKTLLTTMFIVWYCLKYPDRSVLLVADVREKAHKILNSAKTIIRTNKNLRLMFGKKLLAKHGNDASKIGRAHV